MTDGPSGSIKASPRSNLKVPFELERSSKAPRLFIRPNLYARLSRILAFRVENFALRMFPHASPAPQQLSLQHFVNSNKRHYRNTILEARLSTS